MPQPKPEEHRSLFSVRGQPRFYYFCLAVCLLLALTSAVQLYSLVQTRAAVRWLGWTARNSGKGEVVGFVDPSTHAAQKLKRGDRIVGINGDRRAERVAPNWFLGREAAGTSYTIDVQRGDQRLTIPLSVETKPGPLPLNLLQWLVAVVFIIMGGLVGLGRPEPGPHRWAALSSFFSGMYLMYVASDPLSNGLGQGLAMWSSMALASVFPLHYVTGYLFFSRFPQPLPSTRGWRFTHILVMSFGLLLWPLYAGRSLLRALPSDITVAIADRLAGLVAAITAGTSFVAILPVVIFFIIAMSAAGIGNYRRIPEGDQRRRVRWIFLGLFVASAPIVVAVLLWFVVASLGIETRYLWLIALLSSFANLFAVVMPLTMGYAILKHRVMGINVAIRLGVQHLLASNFARVLLLLPAIAFIYNVVTNPGKTVGELLFGSTVNLLLIAAIVPSIRYRKELMRLVDRHFFREAYNRDQILRELADSVKGVDSLSTLSEMLSAEINKALHPKWISVLFRAEDSGDLSVGYSSSGAQLDVRSGEYYMMLDRLERAGGARQWSGLRGECTETEVSFFDRVGVRLLVPIPRTDNKTVGLLLLGDKRSEEPYTSKDRELLEYVAVQIGVVRENLVLRGLVQKGRMVQEEVLARLGERSFNVMKQCPKCGRCYDSTDKICADDQQQLELALPVERNIDQRYRLERLIGKGGMGAVYEATDTRLNRQVALKLMTGRYFGDQAAMRRFSREAQACARLDHPNVVRVYDYGELSNGGAYLVLEYVVGANWRQVLYDHGTFDTGPAADLFEQILRGVAAAHGQGIVHRDLKPENVLIAGLGTPAVAVKILDFGLAKVREAELADPKTMTISGMVLGTPGYMAPEQLSGTEVDARADIYSLGIMLVEAIGGELPPRVGDFHRKTLGMVRRLLAFEGSTAQHRRLREVLLKCIAFNASRRFQSVEEMTEPLLDAMRKCPPLEKTLAKAAAAHQATRTIIE